MDITIYVGMALTEAPDEFRNDFQAELKQALRTIEGVKLLDFIGLENGTEVDVYRHDRKCTVESNLCIFIVDYPSIGLGMEIAYRLETGGPILVFRKANKKVTRMLTGALSTMNLTIDVYDSVAAIESRVRQELKRLNL